MTQILNSISIEVTLAQFCIQLLGNRVDPGLNLLCRTNKRPTVLALLETTCEQVAVSPETAMGAVESGFYKQKRDISVPLVFNNL